MILFTSGFPQAGKTTFAYKLIKELKNKHILHINPKDYYPDDFESLNPEEKTDIATTAWELSLEKLSESIVKLPNKALVIYDTCCSKALQMRPLFMNSHIRGHDIIMVYVNANIKNRFERSTDVEQIKKLEDRYKTSFKESLPILKYLSDYFIIVNNNEDSQLNSGVIKVAEKIKNIRNN